MGRALILALVGCHAAPSRPLPRPPLENVVAPPTYVPKRSTSFTVKRATPALLEVRQVLGTSGECPAGDCTARTLLARVAIPADLTDEQIEEEIDDEDGDLGRFGCGGEDGMAF